MNRYRCLKNSDKLHLIIYRRQIWVGHNICYIYITCRCRIVRAYAIYIYYSFTRLCCIHITDRENIIYLIKLNPLNITFPQNTTFFLIYIVLKKSVFNCSSARVSENSCQWRPTCLQYLFLETGVLLTVILLSFARCLVYSFFGRLLIFLLYS